MEIVELPGRGGLRGIIATKQYKALDVILLKDEVLLSVQADAEGNGPSKNKVRKAFRKLDANAKETVMSKGAGLCKVWQTYAFPSMCLRRTNAKHLLADLEDLHANANDVQVDQIDLLAIHKEIVTNLKDPTPSEVLRYLETRYGSQLALHETGNWHLTRWLCHLNHSCEGNALVCDLLQDGDGSLGLIAVHDIAVGEEIAMDYTTLPLKLRYNCWVRGGQQVVSDERWDLLLLPRIDRQEAIFEMQGFWCSCSKCRLEEQEEVQESQHEDFMCVCTECFLELMDQETESLAECARRKSCNGIAIQKIAGKGFGVVAAKDFARGDTILDGDEVLLEVPTVNLEEILAQEEYASIRTRSAFQWAAIIKAFADVPFWKKRRLMDLHGHHYIMLYGKKTAFSAFATNSWEKAGSTVCFDLISRLNHSCDDNSRISWKPLRLKAARRITKGEEITVSYLGPDTKLPVKDRAKQLRRGWGFTCACPKCDSEAQDKACFGGA